MKAIELPKQGDHVVSRLVADRWEFCRCGAIRPSGPVTSATEWYISHDSFTGKLCVPEVQA